MQVFKRPNWFVTSEEYRRIVGPKSQNLRFVFRLQNQPGTLQGLSAFNCGLADTRKN